MAVNNAQASNLEEGDTLLIPADYHPDSSEVARSSKSRSKSHTHGVASNVHVAKTATPQRATHIVASRRVPPQLLHQKAVVHAASLRH
jgi:hypothetical protein